jgi:excisionase family DNA binding protein
MNITPTLLDGYNGPIKQLTCRVCKHVFYITWADYKRLEEVFYCHECSVIEVESRSTSLSLGDYKENADAIAPFQPLLTIQQVMAVLHLGRTKVYELIAREELPVIRFGRAVRVSPKALQEWLNQRERRG